MKIPPRNQCKEVRKGGGKERGKERGKEGRKEREEKRRGYPLLRRREGR